LVNVSLDPESRRIKLYDTSRRVPPDTSGWEVLFADDFERAEPGGAWDAAGWTIEGGRLRGVLKPTTYQGLPQHAALASLRNLETPESVEVRFDCWVSDEMNSYTGFASAESHGISAWLLANSRHFGTRGAAFVWHGGVMSFPVLTLNPRFEFKPGTRYRVRVVRESGWMTLFVDDREVLATQVPAVASPRLGFGAMYGPEGSSVYLDNVEVRAPAKPRAAP
jgi:hypothetical protein